MWTEGEMNIPSGEATMNLTLPVVKIGSVRSLNIIEFPLENVAKPVVNGKTIQDKIMPYEIVTIGILPSKQNSIVSL
jgi:hypothetical protein